MDVLIGTEKQITTNDAGGQLSLNVKQIILNDANCPYRCPDRDFLSNSNPSSQIRSIILISFLTQSSSQVFNFCLDYSANRSQFLQCIQLKVAITSKHDCCSLWCNRISFVLPGTSYSYVLYMYLDLGLGCMEWIGDRWSACQGGAGLLCLLIWMT